MMAFFVSLRALLISDLRYPLEKLEEEENLELEDEDDEDDEDMSDDEAGISSHGFLNQGCQIVLSHFTTGKIQLHYFYTMSTLHQKYTKNFQFHRLISLPKSFNFEIHRELHYRKVKVQNI